MFIEWRAQYSNRYLLELKNLRFILFNYRKLKLMIVHLFEFITLRIIFKKH